MAESLDDILKGKKIPGLKSVEPVHQLRPENPFHDAAEAKANRLVEEAQLNEAVRVIEKLEGEVSEMTLARRFSRTRIPTKDKNFPLVELQPLSPMLRHLTEEQLKRETLLMQLRKLKDDITKSIMQMHEVILDIEATKVDDDKSPLPGSESR